MAKLRRFAVVVVTWSAWSLAACAASSKEPVAGVDCNKTLCGCWTEQSVPFRLRVADNDGSPVAGTRLTCHDDGSYLATTNEQGVMTLNIEGQSSPGCGFTPDCEIAYLRTNDGGVERPFWLRHLVLGRAVTADDTTIEILADEQTTENALPDPLEAGWKGAPVCEKLHESPQQRILRCSFPPGVGHERHYHKPHFGYAISGGRMQIIDATGTREVDLATGSSFASDGVDWHEVLNVGDTTVLYLIVEPR